MKTRLDFITEGGAVVFTALQTEKVFQIISLILTILSITVSLVFTLWKWYKEANKDGKIDKEEVDEAIEIITKSGKEINNEIDKYNKKKGEN